VLLLATGALAAAVPGPQRAICPQCFGLTDIGNDIFTDDPLRATELRQLVASADRTIEGFFGDTLVSRPRYIFCTTAQCLATFGGGQTGLTYNRFLIRIAPQGIASYIVTHERLHAEIGARAGLRSLVTDAIPVWFDEGLATYLAGDTRFPGPLSDDDVSWIEGGTTRAQWNALLASRDWIAGYGAAEAAITKLDTDLGRERLRAVAEALIAGETLPAALAGTRDQ
jgi:hypothetical protein